MITLIKFGPHFGLPDPSPFVMKLENYLRLAEIDYVGKSGNLRKAPKAKLPCMLMDGQNIGDSELCIAALKDKFGDKLNEGLSDEALARHHFMRLALENHGYFIVLNYRWLKPENEKTTERVFFGPMGVPGKLVFKMVQREFRRTMQGQGILRHSDEELAAMAEKDIAMMTAALGDKPYFGGEEPREIDATMFAFIANMLVPEMVTPYLGPGRRSAPLVAYHNRMVERLYPEMKDGMLVAGPSA